MNSMSLMSLRTLKVSLQYEIKHQINEKKSGKNKIVSREEAVETLEENTSTSDCNMPQKGYF